MPRYNPMYHFLSPTVALPAGIELAPRYDFGDASAYRILNIRDIADISIIDGEKTYILTEHHIRIDKQYDPHLPKFSHSHYTATLTDSNDASVIYQLHVFFNEHGVLAEPPVFSKKSAIGEPPEQPVLSDNLCFQFTQLALKHYRPMMDEFGRQIRIRVSELNREYKAKERLAATIISIEPFDSKAYVSALEEACSVLSDLIALVNSGPYQSIQRLFERFIQSANTLAIESEREAIPVSDNPVVLEAEAPLATVVPPPVSLKPSIEMLDDEIDTHVSTYTRLPREDKFVFLTSSLKLLTLVHALSFETKPVSKDALIKLQKLQSDLYTDIEILYLALLIEEKFDVLQGLDLFHHLISIEILVHAVSNTRPKLLDFILKHGNLDILSEPLVVGERRYSNVLKYCYETNKLALFFTLIQNDLSTLALDEDGLPFAHKILSTEGHPLRGVLLHAKVSHKTVNSIPFNKELIAILTCYLASRPDLDSGVVAEIRGYIESYQLRLTGLKQISSGPSGQALHKASTGIAVKHGDALYVEQLKENPVFKAAAADFQECVGAYLQKQTKGTRIQLERKATVFCSDINELLSASDFTGLSFQIVLEQSLAYFFNCKQFMDKEEKFQRLNVRAKSLSHEERKAHKSLVKEMAELQTKMLNPYSSPATTRSDSHPAKSQLDGLDSIQKDIASTVDERIKEAQRILLTIANIFTDSTSTPQLRQNVLNQLDGIINILDKYLEDLEPFVPEDPLGVDHIGFFKMSRYVDRLAETRDKYKTMISPSA